MKSYLQSKTYLVALNMVGVGVEVKLVLRKLDDDAQIPVLQRLHEVVV